MVAGLRDLRNSRASGLVVADGLRSTHARQFSCAWPRALETCTVNPTS